MHQRNQIQFEGKGVSKSKKKSTQLVSRNFYGVKMAEVGKFSGKNTTNFKQTCNLLSRYIKEKGSFNGLRLGMSCSLDGQDKFTSPATTMDLLPKIESRECTPDLNSSSFLPYYNSIDSRKESVPENAQLTIFYGGKVLVFDHFPSEKAKEIMLLAAKGSAGDVVSMSPGVVSCTGSTGRLPQRFPTPAGSDLPIMRKNSLHRFLEKRKDRITAKAPYPAPAAAGKPESSMPWLGLSPQT